VSGILDQLLKLGEEQTKPKATPRPLTPMEQLEMIASGAVQDQLDKQADEALVKDLNARNEAEGTFGIPITRSPFQTPGTAGYDRETLGGSKVSATTFKRQGLVPPVQHTEAAAALFRGTGASILHGLMFPVSSLMPNWYKSVGETQEADRATMEKFLTQSTYGQPGLSPQKAAAASYLPQVIGEFGSMAIPGTGAIKAANAMWKVGKASSNIAKIARTGAAGMQAGGMFSVFAEADSGEDRVYNVMRDSLIGGAVDLGVILATTHRALRTEIRAGKKLEKITEEIAAKTGQSTEAVESKMGSIRNGSVGTDVETAEEVLRATMDTPAAQSPVASQSAKIVEAFKMRSPSFWTADPKLTKKDGITIITRINGQVMPTTFKSDPLNRDKDLFTNTVKAWAQTLEAARTQGHQVEILTAVHSAQSKGAANHFMNLLEGRTGQKKKPVNSAPQGTVSHSARVPQAGDAVTVRVPGGGRTNATVLEVGPTAGGGPGQALTTPEEAIVRRNKKGGWDVVSASGTETFTSAREAQGRARALSDPEVIAGAARVEAKRVETEEAIDQLRTRFKEEQGKPADYVVTEECHSPCKWTVRTKQNEILEEFGDAKSAQAYARSIAGKGEYIRVVRPGVEAAPPKKAPRIPPKLDEIAGRTEARVSLGLEPKFAEQPKSTILREKSLEERVAERRGAARSMSHREQGVPQELEPYITEDAWSVLDYGKRIRLAQQAGLPDLARELMEEGRAYGVGIKAQREAGAAVTRRMNEITGPPPPEATPLTAAGMQPGYVRLEVGGKEIVVPFTDVDALLPRQGPTLELKAHRNGKERRFILDMQNGTVSAEPLDSPGDIYRTPFFTSADPSSDYEHKMMRLFGHRDGSVTMSSTPVVLQEFESQTGKRANIGRLDRLQPSAPSEFGDYRQSFGGKSAAGDLAPTEEGEYWSNRFGAGFEPPRQRISQRKRGSDLEVEDFSGIEDRSLVWDENVALEDLDPTARRRVSKTHEEGLSSADTTERKPVRWRNPVTGKWELGDPRTRVSTIKSYEFHGKNQGTNPNAVQFRNAARLLIKQGVAESTPVRLRVSHTTHAPGKQAPVMTLREAADMDLGWVTPRELEREANVRGFTVQRDPVAGTWTVENYADGKKQTFQHPMEAMDAIARVPVTKSGVKIEDELERALNMGRGRGMDPDVDSKIFVPAKAVDQAFQEVVTAGRPGMEMYVLPTGEIGKAAEGANKVQAIIDSFAMKVPQMRSLRAWTASKLVNGRQKVFVYDENKIRQLLTQWERGFQTFGVEVKGKPIAAVLDEIDTKIPDGLDILKGRDPSDAFMYSWYKSKSMKEEFMRGKLVADSQGPYRVFPPEEKSAAFAKLPPC
jgi:hypothetical protein